MASERSSESARVVSCDDAIDRRISARTKEQEANANQENVEHRAEPAFEAAHFVEVGSVVGFAHAQVGHAPEDEAEEGVEERAHQGQQVAEEGDDFGDDEGEGPQAGEDAAPAYPAERGVRGQVAGVGEDAEEEEACGDGGVEHTEEDDGGDHEAEADFQVGLVAERAEGGRRVVLCAGVDVDDGADEGEDDHFRDRHSPQRFGEVLGILHLGDERGEGDLADEGVADVHEGVHPGNEGGAFCCDYEPSGLSESWILAASNAAGVVFDPGEDGCQDDGDEREEG